MTRARMVTRRRGKQCIQPCECDENGNDDKDDDDDGDEEEEEEEAYSGWLTLDPCGNSACKATHTTKLTGGLKTFEISNPFLFQDVGL